MTIVTFKPSETLFSRVNIHTLGILALSLVDFEPKAFQGVERSSVESAVTGFETESSEGELKALVQKKHRLELEFVG